MQCLASRYFTCELAKPYAEILYNQSLCTGTKIKETSVKKDQSYQTNKFSFIG